MAKHPLVALGAAALLVGCGAKAAPPPAPPPPPKPFHIVFPEGFTRAQMAERVKVVANIAAHERNHKKVRLTESTYLVASKNRVAGCFDRTKRANLEGFLFPATYPFFKQTTSRALVLEQIKTFCRRWRRVNLAYARSKNLTPYDVLTIASMVEREASVPSERRLVAAVIYNRLHNRMQLGIDATLRYGLHIPPTKSITRSELESSNPYNTRRFFGLPPTPIASPGLAAIQAAAHPARVDYLYYVRKPHSLTHYFTANESDFLRKVCEYGYACK